MHSETLQEFIFGRSGMLESGRLAPAKIAAELKISDEKLTEILGLDKDALSDAGAQKNACMK